MCYSFPYNVAVFDAIWEHRAVGELYEERGGSVNELKALWLDHIHNVDHFANFDGMSEQHLASWFEPLINSITEDGAVPYLLNTKERYRASPLSSTIIWLASENLVPVDVLDKMQNELLYLRDHNIADDPQTPNDKKHAEDFNGWSIGEGVSVWSTSMAIIALLDPLGNGKKKAANFKESVLWLARQNDSTSHGWAYQLSDNCVANATMTSLALRALAMAIEPCNRDEFKYSSDDLHQIRSVINTGFDYLKNECKRKQNRTFWCFNEKPSCAATTWALMALRQIGKTEDEVSEDAMSFYNSVLDSSLSFVLSKMPSKTAKWNDEQIVCEGGAKYNKQKNYYSFSATLLPQLFELGLSPFNKRVISQIDWLINNTDRWKIEGYDKTTICTFTYAMVLSTLLCWARHVGVDFSLVLIKQNNSKNKLSKFLFGYASTRGMNCQLVLKSRLWLCCGILCILVLILIFGATIHIAVLKLSSLIAIIWSKTASDRRTIILNVISTIVYVVIGAIFITIWKIVRRFIKRQGSNNG